jgi:hypothetical protein
MTRKHKEEMQVSGGRIEGDEFINMIGDLSDDEVYPEPVFVPVPKPLFIPVKWAGTIPTFRCEKCGHCDPDKDNMIEHVLTHVPENDRDELLEKLLKE